CLSLQNKFDTTVKPAAGISSIGRMIKWPFNSGQSERQLSTTEDSVDHVSSSKEDRSTNIAGWCITYLVICFLIQFCESNKHTHILDIYREGYYTIYQNHAKCKRSQKMTYVLQAMCITVHVNM
ncbi:hypothetical protein M8C21_011940, partial [Ambrosia artemisiifolia]